MLAYFPNPYPDELLFSLVSRLAETMQYPQNSDFSRAVYGQYRTGIAVGLPNHLNCLLAHLPPGHGLTLDRLLTAHTLFPFYQPFLPPERVERLKEVMGGNQGQSINNYLGTNWTVPLPAFLRFCPECVTADRAQYGQTYWHRLHQLPGVHVCPQHETILQPSHTASYLRPPSQRYISAEQALDQVKSVRSPILPSTYPILRDLATDAQWLLTHTQHLVTVNSFRRRFQSILMDLELMTQTGKVRSSALLAAFERRYSPQILQFLGCPLHHDNHAAWPRQVVTTQWLKHPLQCLLVIRCLGYSVEEFFALPVETLSFEGGPWPCLNPACPHYRQWVIQKCQVALRSTNSQPYATFACQCGFVYGRFGPDHVPEDRFRLDKIVTYGPVWLAHWQKLQADPAISRGEMARRLNVNRSTVRKWFKILPQDLRLENGSPPLPPTPDLKGRERYRHNEDVELAEMIRRAALALLTQPGKPTRLTRVAICRYLNQSSFVTRLKNLPLTTRTLATLVEPYETFVIRRMEWATDFYAAQHISPLKMQLLNLAGVTYYFSAAEANPRRAELFEQLMNREPNSLSLRHARVYPTDQAWSAFDIQLAGLVEKVAEQLRHKSGYPTRITGVTLGVELGKLEVMLDHLDLLPQTAALLSKTIEPIEAFVARVLDWVQANDPEVARCDQLREFIELTGLKLYLDQPMEATLIRTAFAKLQELKPSRKPIDWPARDRMLALAVRKAVTNLSNQAGSVVKITRNAIGQMIDDTDPLGICALSLLFCYLPRLPETTQVLAEVIETQEQFAIRRLEYVATHFRDQGLRPTRSELLAEASAKKFAASPLVEPTINRILASFGDLPSAHERSEQQQWRQRDAELAVLVTTAAEYLKNQSNPLVAVSGKAIGRSLGGYDLRSERLKYLPRTTAALAQVLETAEAFAIRRIQWFAACYQQRQVRPSRYDFTVAAGVASMVKKRPAIDALVSQVLHTLASFPPEWSVRHTR